MKTPLLKIDILSIYKNSLGDQVPLPSRMAYCTPDTCKAIMSISRDLSEKGGKLILSDLFRSYDMQAQAYYDYASGKKEAYSPPPGGSFHEAGRAFDLDLSKIKISLAKFWDLAAKYGVVPIISKPLLQSEAWHFDCRGSHQLVYQYYAEGKGHGMSPYTAAATSAILSIGTQVDRFEIRQKQAAIQSCLIRLGKEIGDIDGYIGCRTQKALTDFEIEYDYNNIDEITMKIENLVQQKFPEEFTVPQSTDDNGIK